MSTFATYNIDSGRMLMKFMEDCGIKNIRGTSLDSSQNVIHLKNNMTLSWKSSKQIARVNVKENDMIRIEQNTSLNHINNGDGDPTHEYSFIIDNLSDLVDLIGCLKKCD